MATAESIARMARRRHQRSIEQWRADPVTQALRRQVDAQQRYRQRYPFSGVHPGLLRMHCVVAGLQQGGRPPKARRCTKQRGARYC
jgi:hypothetical protein